jgi:adenylate cyclase
VRIFELLGRAGEVDASLHELRDLYVEGLAAYRRQDWDTAEQRFAECLRRCPDDGPAAVLRERSVAFRAAPPPPDWDGVWRLNEK